MTDSQREKLTKLEKALDTEKKDHDKQKKKRNHRMDLQSFLHGIVEQILQKTERTTRNGTLKKQKFRRDGRAEKLSFSYRGVKEGFRWENENTSRRRRL
ncbi:hypothetical protein F6Y05_05370 [Bacillus megaterium]|nr:hypothetical protein [Priestia megaterium]